MGDKLHLKDSEALLVGLAEQAYAALQRVSALGTACWVRQRGLGWRLGTGETAGPGLWHPRSATGVVAVVRGWLQDVSSWVVL